MAPNTQALFHKICFMDMGHSKIPRIGLSLANGILENRSKESRFSTKVEIFTMERSKIYRNMAQVIYFLRMEINISEISRMGRLLVTAVSMKMILR